MRSMVALLLSAVVLWPLQARATELTHEQLYAATAPGVVFVYGRSGTKGMGGSGSIIRADGLVLTSAHVVLKPDTDSPHDRIWVALKPDHMSGEFDEDLKNRFPAVVQVFNRALDLALLKVTKPLPAVTVLTFGDSDRVNIGAQVVAIGHPEQGGLWTLTTGVISAFKANYKDVQGKHMFQTETSMNLGNSGGPLIDREGRQIGVNSAVARRGKNGLTITDVNFSLRSNVAVAWMAEEGVTLEHALEIEDSGGNDLPAVASDELPVAVSVLPPDRPYRFSQIDHWATRTEQDMEDMAGELRKHIRAKEDRGVPGFAGQASAAPPGRPGTAQALRSMPPHGQETRPGAETAERVAEPPEHELDCRVYETQTSDLMFGLKAGTFFFSIGPEVGVRSRSGIAWKKVVQGTIARYIELCNRYNAGMVTKAEYETRLETIEVLYKEAQQLQAQLMEATRRQAQSGFDELERETGTMPGSPTDQETEWEDKAEHLAERIEQVDLIGRPLTPSSPCAPPDMLGAPGARPESEETC